MDRHPESQPITLGETGGGWGRPGGRPVEASHIPSGQMMALWLRRADHGFQFLWSQHVGGWGRKISYVLRQPGLSIKTPSQNNSLQPRYSRGNMTKKVCKGRRERAEKTSFLLVIGSFMRDTWVGRWRYGQEFSAFWAMDAVCGDFTSLVVTKGSLSLKSLRGTRHMPWRTRALKGCVGKVTLVKNLEKQ